MTWAGWQTTITAHKRRLVLPGRYGQDGDSSLPPEAAEAACHGGTMPITGHRAATAETLGMHRMTLRKKLKELGMSNDEE